MKSHFFDDTRLSHIKIVGIFSIKLLVAFLLVEIYSNFYKDRSTADIFKYFDDSKYIYQSLYINPKHYLQLVFGYHCDAHYLDVYTAKTINWDNQTDEYLKATHSMNFHFFESNRLITRINALIRIFSFGYYSVHCIIIIFIEMFGLIALYKAFKPKVIGKTNLLILCIFFTPSILLWSSGILKESIAFLGLGLFLYYYFLLQQLPFKLKYIIGLILAFTTIVGTKYYIAIALIPPAIAYYIANKSKMQFLFLKYFFINIFLLICIINIPIIHPSINPFEILRKKQNIAIMSSAGGAYYASTGMRKDTIYFSPNDMCKLTLAKEKTTISKDITFRYFKNGVLSHSSYKTTGDSIIYIKLFWFPKAGSYIEIKKVNPTIKSICSAIPLSFFNATCQPLHIMGQNALIVLSSIEMMFVYIFLFTCFYFRKYNCIYKNEILFCINFSLILYLIIGLTTPVIGSIVRFRIFPLLLLLIAGLIGLDNKKLGVFVSNIYCKIKINI